jgi:Arc/MetJ-type ribon-helix-helix transcriptional regulator
MNIILPDDLESSVRGEVLSGHFASADDAVAEIVREYFRHRQGPRHQDSAAAAPATEPANPPERKPLWERAAELRQSIPAEEWDKLPDDGSRQLDHYLYGSPKRTDA